MPIEEQLKNIIEQCTIFYDGMPINNAILDDYLRFLSNSDNKRVKISLHTGSKCFDIISVVYSILFPILKSNASNDEMIDSLKSGDMIIFGHKRQRYLGTEIENGIKYIIIEEDGTGRNGACRTKAFFDNAKSSIRPYRGTSLKTGGTGVRTKKTNRDDFLAWFLNISEEDVPTIYDFSVFILSDKQYFEDIYTKTSIAYGNKRISLLDLGLPISYYTKNGEEKQFGHNQTKSDPNLIYTERLSVVRDLTITKRSGYVLILKQPYDSEGYSELEDISSFSFVENIVITAPIYSPLSSFALGVDIDASFYVCTKKYISSFSPQFDSRNELLKHLTTQLSNIAHKEVSRYSLPGIMDPGEYRKFRKEIKYLQWNEPRKNDFQLYALSLLKLLTTSFFTMNELDTNISSGEIETMAKSPAAKLEAIRDIATSSNNDACKYICKVIGELYDKYLNDCPKKDKLFEIISEHPHEKILIVAAKSYYANFFNGRYSNYGNVSCTTADKFDSEQFYDYIIATSSQPGKRFNPATCNSAKKIIVLVYDSERLLYDMHAKETELIRNQLEARVDGTPKEKILNLKDCILTPAEQASLEEEDDIDSFMRQLSIPNFSHYTSNDSYSDNSTIEVCYVGTFVNDEKIVFTKNYKAVVYKQGENVEEKSVDSLSAGDQLVFLKKNEYTRNIVDYLFEKLLSAGKLAPNIYDDYEKSRYWKTALLDFKTNNNLTFTNIEKLLKKMARTYRRWQYSNG